MPRFHPDQFLLNDYAAGSLPGAVALAVAAHLEFCARCRSEAAQLNSLGAQIFSQLDPVPVNDDAFQEVMRRIEQTDSPAKPSCAAGHSVPPSGLPRVLSTLIPQGLDGLDWRRISTWLRVARLRFGDNTREVVLHHISAGGRVLEHGHAGTETTVVLRGRFSDQDGCYEAGDFLARGPADVHRPVAAEATDCLCLAVLDAPIRLTGLLGLIANPFLRIHPR